MEMLRVTPPLAEIGAHKGRVLASPWRAEAGHATTGTSGSSHSFGSCQGAIESSGSCGPWAGSQPPWRVLGCMSCGCERGFQAGEVCADHGGQLIRTPTSDLALHASPSLLPSRLGRAHRAQ